MKKTFVLSMALLMAFGGLAAQVRCDSCDRLFIQAAQWGDIAGLRRHLACSWSNLNARDDGGKTALMWAVTNWHPHIISFLLNPPADLRPSNAAPVNLNIEDNVGMTVLMHAIRTRDIAIVSSLLRWAGGRINVNHQSKNGSTALHVAVMTDMDTMVMMLLEQPTIDPNLVDLNGRSAFMLALERRNRSMLEWFARSPYFDVTRSPHGSVPPLLEALRLGLSPTLIEDILFFFPDAINSRDDRGNGPSEWLVKYGRHNAADRMRIRDVLDDARVRNRW